MEAQIIHLLRELKAELDATIVLVSHNLGLIAELCDEVAVMYAGEIVEKGSVQQIFYDPVHPYTQALLECDPARVLKQTRLLPIIPGDMPDLHDIAKGCEFAPRCSQSLDLCHLKPPSEHHLKTAKLYGVICTVMARCLVESHLLKHSQADPQLAKRLYKVTEATIRWALRYLM